MRVLAGVLLAIGLFISVQPVEARTVTVFGDSLSDWKYSYAEQLRSPTLRIRNYGWAGLKQRDFDLPRYFACNRARGTEVILALGTNDAAEGRIMQYNRSLNDTLALLAVRRCTVYLLMAVPYKGAPVAVDKIRTIQRKLADLYPNVTLVDPYYDKHETTDGLHPTEYGHSLIASQFRELLGE